ncbi:hypothetical protein [Salinivibrio sp. KP-1]|uniref:hypothetical protein n=1 Tax=Salinivibrio sp. KP-1 TaxID=1406902 RepID=UPI0006145D05|nr:hypothetical protein [Salinivibrio sp. KP-1]KKA43634.1 hypothetical protein WN56_14870 [Salinivibrio sp. KP-1]
MSKKFETTWFYASLETRKEIKPSGFLGLKSELIDTPEAKVANLDEFSEQLENIYNTFNDRGYDVVNVVPISMGGSEPCHAKMSNGQKNYLGETGYSITRGAIVVGKRRD